MSDGAPRLSVVIPAHNEEGCIEATLRELANHLVAAGIEHEILVVNDHSTDRTESILQALGRELPSLRHVNNPGLGGFGLAVRAGLERFAGDAVAVYMADASDRPADLERFYRRMVRDRVDCVFGTRFSRQSKVVDYPRSKLVLNRLVNWLIRVSFGLQYNDVTNAFKLYGRRVIDGTQPLLSEDFNLTVELPLKSIVRGYSYAVEPNDWINRRAGSSKLKLKEMGSRYAYVVLYCLIEKRLARRQRRAARPGAGPIA